MCARAFWASLAALVRLKVVASAEPLCELPPAEPTMVSPASNCAIVVSILLNKYL